MPTLFQDLLVLLPSQPPLEEGSWFGGVALRGMDGNLYLVAGKLLLLSRGLDLPDLPEGRLLNRPGQFVVATTHLTEAQTLEVLKGFAQHELAPPLQELLGAGVRLPFEKEAMSNWYINSADFRSHWVSAPVGVPQPASARPAGP